MSDFFLPQMGDLLTECVCFDTSLLRGNGGSSVWQSPILCEGQPALTLPHRTRAKRRAGGPTGLRPNNTLFYFRRFLRAFSALSTPLFEPPVPLPFFSPDTLSLTAFVAVSLTFLPMSAMLTTLLYSVRFYSSTKWS